MADWYGSNTPKKEGENNEGHPVNVKVPSYTSRRSPVLCRNGCVASSQPLASSIGLQILRDKNGNAADASIAVAAALCVLEPCSTGLGGDMFALIYTSSDKSVKAVNGSGRSPHRLTLDHLKKQLSNKDDDDNTIDITTLSDRFRFDVNAVTVPGAAQGWEDVHKHFGSGRLSLSELLEPAAQLAEEGFPVSTITAHSWTSNYHMIERWLSKDNTPPKDMPLSNKDGRPPQPGDIVYNPHMAAVLRRLGELGSQDGFYSGETGQNIVNAIQRHGGVMEMEDLKQHTSTFPDPINVQYRHTRLWQVPPNGQGIAGLIALKGVAALEKAELCEELCEESVSNTAGAFHVMMEMMRLGFADARKFVKDPDHEKENKDKHNSRSNEWLLDDDRIINRATSLFDKDKAVVQGELDPTSCTVSFQVVDSEGNAVSFVNSNFMGFGTGIVPDNCGFTLQNRGFGFSLDPNHPNALAPNKRPYHTIIPGMLTHVETGDLYATLSNMGGFMQPQGHMQLTIGMVAGNLNPQEAIDMPRFCIADGSYGGAALLEEGVDEKEVDRLKQMGQNIKPGVSGFDRSVFGKAQIIKKDPVTGVLWAGSDGRSDGCAMGY